MTEQFKRDLISFPTPFLRAIQKNTYSKGSSDFSVTQLISAPKRTWLATQMERVETPYSSFSAFLGTTIHTVLEANVDESLGEIAERRFFMDIMGVTVSGQADFIEGVTLFDYKSTRGVQEAMKPDHKLQVMLNARLAIENGVPIENVAVVYITMDWSWMQSQINPNYPQSPFKIFTIPYDAELADRTFARTIADHKQALAGNPRECTDDETWAKPDTFALIKPGAKRASKLCATLAEAEQERKSGQVIQVRKGERTFCQAFCGYGSICSSYQKYLSDKASTNEEP